MMDRNKFMSRIKVIQTVDYNKLLLIQRNAECIHKDTIKDFAALLNKLTEREKEELEDMYQQQIEKLENEIKRKKHI